jgi:hypothetical protein
MASLFFVSPTVPYSFVTSRVGSYLILHDRQGPFEQTLIPGIPYQSSTTMDCQATSGSAKTEHEVCSLAPHQKVY